MKKITLFLLGFVVLLLGACTDDDSFTLSSNNLLTFSTDTLRMDTVFSRVPSATRSFWVYNKSGDGIRCTNIRLERGNQTGYRVNVDGIYLGQSEGFQTNNIEIRNKDSIRVFVELTTPDMLRDEPTRVEDNLIFTLESGVQQRVNLNGYAWDALMYGQLDIIHDTTITSTRPIVIKEGLKVDSSATLTLGAGTTLYFGQKAGVDVYGTLVAEGTADKNVVFRGDRIDWMFDYLPYDRTPGMWQGIRFHSSSYENKLHFADIHSAYDGVVCDSSSLERLKLEAYNTTISTCQGYGLVETNCMVDLYNCQITNTLNDCAAFFGGAAVLRHCTLAQFYPFNAERGQALRFSNYRESKDYPLHQFDVYNTLVTGYADDVIMGDFHDNVAGEYKFDHCLLRTTEPEELSPERFIAVRFEDIKDTVKAGEKNFAVIDADNQYYDFHLRGVSLAVDSAAGLPNGYGATDRDGRERDNKPDIGCYEYHE